MVVVPPQAAARVPVSKSSEANVPPKGSSMWVWHVDPAGDHVFAGGVDDAFGTTLGGGAWSNPGAATATMCLAVDQHLGRIGTGRGDRRFRP